MERSTKHGRITLKVNYALAKKMELAGGRLLGIMSVEFKYYSAKD
jgi:hypothetical protein